ncbi:Conserved_hypothetical protein [Hexamita inflata]|uniref:Transmembrane protein n=1 Tax=Hexamita inflata TaxID=28002 RepID=A0AA86QJP0_9EUKA|nr:Conserved hypothetical protein [Hexamita inflata]
MILSLTCFDINSTVIYLRQSKQVIFQAWPSSILNADQYYICNTILKNKEYNIQIQIGQNIFQSQSTYNYTFNSNIQIQLNCKVNNQCQYSLVSGFNIAIFRLVFSFDGIEISSVAGQYENRIFDHLQCKIDTFAAVSLVAGAEQIIAYTTPVSECSVKPATEIMTMIPMIGENIVSMTEVNLSAPPFNLPLSYQPIYMKYVNIIPFICASRPDKSFCIQIAYGLMQNEFVLFNSRLRTQINVRYQGVVQKFDQTIRFIFKQIRSTQQSDCFSSSKITFYDQSIRIQAQPGTCTSCSVNYFEQIGIVYNQVFLRISIILNEDHSGLTYQNEFQVSTNIFGKSIDQVITCDMMNDRKACLEDMPIIIKSLQQNSTINFVIVFKMDEMIVYRAIYNPQITQPQIQTAQIYFYNNKICIKYQPYEADQVIIQLLIDQTYFTIYSKSDPSINLYCNSLIKLDDDNIRQIVKQKIQLSATVNINNEIINNVPVLILQSEKQPYYAWIIAAIIVLLTFVSVLILSQCYK